MFLQKKFASTRRFSIVDLHYELPIPIRGRWWLVARFITALSRISLWHLEYQLTHDAVSTFKQRYINVQTALYQRFNTSDTFY